MRSASARVTAWAFIETLNAINTVSVRDRFIRFVQNTRFRTPILRRIILRCPKLSSKVATAAAV